MLEDTNQQAAVGTLIPPGSGNFPVRDGRRDVDLTENTNHQTTDVHLTKKNAHNETIILNADLTMNTYNETIAQQQFLDSTSCQPYWVTSRPIKHSILSL